MIYYATNMQAPYPLILTKQYLEEVPKWLRVIRAGESASVLFFPKTDRLRRLQQLMEDNDLLDSHLGKSTKYIFQITDLSTVTIEDLFDLQEYLARQLKFSQVVATGSTFDDCITFFKKHNVRLVLVLYQAEKYLTPATKNMLVILSQLIVECAPYIIVLSFYEMNLTHPTLLAFLPSSTNLYDNLFYYPVYSQDAALSFVKYLEKKWDIKLESKAEEEIVDRCGGHFWLVKEAMREVSESGRWSINSEGINFRLNAIYKALLPSEQSLLEKLAADKKNFTGEESQSLSYLKKMNVVAKKNHFLIPALQDFIDNYHLREVKFIVKDGLILFNNVPLSRFFSRKEYRVMKALLDKKGMVVTRDEIAVRVWPTNTSEHYSDWAIDQLIARIRKRMLELSLPGSLVQVVRGRGYRLNVL